MSDTNETPIDSEAALSEVDAEANRLQAEHDRAEEVPALLGASETADEEARALPVPEAAEDVNDNAPESEPVVQLNQTAAATEASGERPDSGELFRETVELELKNIMESLQDSLANTNYVSSRIDTVASDTDTLLKQINGLSLNYELLAAEMEVLTSANGADNRSKLSKMVPTISAIGITILAVFQIYSLIFLINAQQNKSESDPIVLENISKLDKKMALYDANLNKALEKIAPQEHVQPNPGATEKPAHDAPTHGATVHAEAPTVQVTPMPEKLNKLRNGLPEKKLIRKESGDWFVYNNKKSEECISDADIIDALNLAYKKIGRSLTTPVPMPAHNALCILKPNGKGGTEIVMTNVFVP